MMNSYKRVHITPDKYYIIYGLILRQLFDYMYLCYVIIDLYHTNGGNVCQISPMSLASSLIGPRTRVHIFLLYYLPNALLVLPQPYKSI